MNLRGECMGKSSVISKLRNHERELRAAGIVRLPLFVQLHAETNRPSLTWT